MKLCPSIRTFTLAALMGAAALVHAQQTITIYSNNFETLNAGAPACANGVGEGPLAWDRGGTFSGDYSTPANPLTQIHTADRLCTTNLAGGAYLDPANPSNNYAGGIIAAPSSSPPWIESISLVFDPQSKPFLTFSQKWSISELAIQRNFWPQAATTVNVNTRYFKVPQGATLTLQDTGDSPAIVLIDNVQATAVQTTATPVTRTNVDIANQLTFDWQPQQDTLDLNALGFAPTDRVGVVFNVTANSPTEWVYLAFDNMLVTASQTPPGTIPPTITQDPPATVDTTQKPTLSGQVQNPGSNTTVQITVVDSATGQTYGPYTATIGPDGKYSTPGDLLPAGNYNVTATVGGVVSNTVPLVVTSVPATNPPTITLDPPATVNTTQPPVLSGQVQNPGSNTTVQITVVDSATGQTYGPYTAPIGPDGKYSVPGGLLPAGNYNVTATVGGVTSNTAPLLVTSVTTPPVGSATPVPSLGQWALMLLSMVLAGFAALRLRQR